MADDADRATEIDEIARSRLIKNHVARIKIDSPDNCDCGRIIPEARKASVPGVQTCIDCQEQIERARRA